VENSTSFRDFIFDTASGVGGQSRYYPGELSTGQCKRYFYDVRDAKPQDKRRVFDAICKHRSPVFRYFFVEKFGRSLETWYASKQRFTRSVAVSSMVGHILGIGKLLCRMSQFTDYLEKVD